MALLHGEIIGVLLREESEFVQRFSRLPACDVEVAEQPVRGRIIRYGLLGFLQSFFCKVLLAPAEIESGESRAWEGIAVVCLDAGPELCFGILPAAPPLVEGSQSHARRQEFCIQ